jgi:hypothetical protein
MPGSKLVKFSAQALIRVLISCKKKKKGNLNMKNQDNFSIAKPHNSTQQLISKIMSWLKHLIGNSKAYS